MVSEKHSRRQYSSEEKADVVKNLFSPSDLCTREILRIRSG